MRDGRSSTGSAVAGGTRPRTARCTARCATVCAHYGTRRLAGDGRLLETVVGRATYDVYELTDALRHALPMARLRVRARRPAAASPTPGVYRVKAYPVTVEDGTLWLETPR